MSDLNTDFPPSLRQFIAAGQDNSVDYQAAYFRMIEKKPKGRLEQWVYENHSYNIKLMSTSQGEKAHRKCMMQAIQLQDRGELKLNAEILANALPEKVERNMNDIARQEWEESGKKHKFSDRIERLRRTKRPAAQDKG